MVDLTNVGVTTSLPRNGKEKKRTKAFQEKDILAKYSGT
jgi:hypothetical protein